MFEIWVMEASHSHGERRLGGQQLGEDAGDEVHAAVVQHHLPMDQDDAVHSNLPRQRTVG